MVAISLSPWKYWCQKGEENDNENVQRVPKKNIRYIGQWFDPFQQNLSAITKCLLQRGLILKLKELLTKQSNEENMRSGNI